MTMLQDNRDSTHGIQSVVRAPLKAGILVFSSTRKALYVNEAAKVMLMRLKQQENGHSTGAIPNVIDRLVEDILPMLRTAGRPHGWGEVTAKPSIAASDPPIWIKAFGVHGAGDDQRSLVVITIQETPAAS